MSAKPTITLTSDWRLRDPYTAIFKGSLIHKIPDATIIDITHHIDFNNLSQTAFLLLRSYLNFPKGSIHIILTQTSSSSNFNPVVFQHNDHYFISEDNGIFCLMFGPAIITQPGRIYDNDDPMPVFDKIIDLAKAITENRHDAITNPYETFVSKYMPEAIDFTNENTIEGEITYIDANGNAITNIPTEMFLAACPKQQFEGTIESKTEWPITEYHPNYVESKKFYFTNNILGCLEITYFRGKIAILADFKVGDKVKIKY